jgi:SHS2 domain-containing protein
MLAACGARAGSRPAGERHVSLRAPDREGLLVRWLQEVLLCLEVDRLLPTRIEVTVSPTLELDARWEATALDGVEKPIKAVTYHDLHIDQAGGELEATVVFDV